MLLKIWQHLEVRERILEPDSNEREQFSKIAQIENDQFKRKLIESIGLCHYRLANYEDALAQFQIAESLLKKHEHSHFKRLNMFFIHCFVGSQLIDQALGRYDHLLEYIRKHSEAEWEYATCMNKKIKLMRAQKNGNQKYKEEIKRSIGKIMEVGTKGENAARRQTAVRGREDVP